MLVSQMDVISPTSIQECLSLLAKYEKQCKLLAGGSDAIVRMKEGKWQPKIWVNIKQLDELRYIRVTNDAIHIGPLTTHTDIIHSSLLHKKANVLVEAAREIGAIQIQNSGTIGGNLATASPAGDTIPALYVLSTVLEISSVKGKRLVPIEDFFLGPGKTILKENEMITNIIIQPHLENEISIFEKLGPRKAQSISIVNVAISLLMNENRQCLGGKIAFGSVAPTIIRAKKCEKMLTLSPLTNEYIQNIAQVAWKEVMPITDVRATATYRRDMASALLERGLYRLMRRWEEI